MKFRLGFKTPDVLDQLPEQCIDPNEDGLAVEQVLGKYVRYSEYITIEFDTDTQEAKVVPL